MLVFGICVCLLADDPAPVSATRPVVVLPGFESAYGSLEIDKLIVSPAGEALLKSTRGFAGRRDRFASELPVGSTVTLVFTGRPKAGGVGHSIAGPFEVTAGTGPLELTANTAPREPVLFACDAATASPQEFLVEIPIPNGELFRDRRDDDQVVVATSGYWAVPVDAATKVDPASRARSIVGLIEGLRYRATVASGGFNPQAFTVDPEQDAVTVKLVKSGPLRVVVMSSTGEPIAGARCAVRKRQSAANGRVSWPVLRNELGETVSDDDGVIELDSMIGETEYDLFVDAGDRGRTIVSSVRAGERVTARLPNDPPIAITLTNVPEQAADGILVDERLDGPNEFNWIRHGPFEVSDGTSVIELPAPVSDSLEFTAPGLSDWNKTLRLNARGRNVTLDLSEPTDEFYAEPLLAPPKRSIRLEFVTADGRPAPDPTAEFRHFNRSEQPGMFSVSRWKPGDEDRSSRSYRSYQFLKRTGGWEHQFGTEETIRVDLEEVWIDGYLIHADLSLLIRPDEDDVAFQIPLVEAVDYRLFFDDFAALDFLALRVAVASVGYSRVGNNAYFAWKRKDQLMPPIVRVPKGVPSLVTIGSEPNLFVRRLDGTGGDLRFDLADLKPTSLQAYDDDGLRTRTHVDGFVLAESGIAGIVEGRSAFEEITEIIPGGTRTATRSTWNLDSNIPLQAVANQVHVVSLTPGVENRVDAAPPRDDGTGVELWVDLLDASGADLKYGGNIYPKLVCVRSDGVELQLRDGPYRGWFRGIPTKDIVSYRYRVYVENYGYAEREVDPMASDVIGLVVEFPRSATGPVALTPHSQGSTGQRKKNRDFERERRR